MNLRGLYLPAGCALAFCAALVHAQIINLPSSKQLIGPVPGHPQRLNSLPVSMTVSPDKRYVVTVNTGYGTFESNYEQSLSVLDTATGKIADFPDSRTSVRKKQVLYSGLAFSRDGKQIYATMVSLTRPTGNGRGALGNNIVVYSFSDGKIAPERLIPIPLQQLARGKITKLVGHKEGDKGLPYPAALAVVGPAGAEKLLVADDLSDNVLLLDPATGVIEKRFDLSEGRFVPSAYPIALSVTKDGKRAFVALWNASEIAELDLASGKVMRKLALLRPSNPIAPGSHPCDFAQSPDGRTLYVALSNRDAVAAVNIGKGAFAVKGYFDTRLPGQSYFGAEPVALAVNGNGSRLYVANMATDTVAVLNTKRLTASVARKTMVEPIGFVPTEWMPMSMAFIPSSSGGKLYVASDKGKGSGPNNFPRRESPQAYPGHYLAGSGSFILFQLYGSLATLDEAAINIHLAQWTAVALESNRMKAAQQKIVFADGSRDRIRHVIYIIKENRTYDQIFGDLEENGKRVGNGDPALTMYGANITPNEHKLALQFGVLDNFFTSGEVSSDGHVWSTAAIGSDYLERTWQTAYHSGQHTHDCVGVVADGYPLQQNIPDINDPASGYLWGNLARHGKTYYQFGEFISQTYCNEKAVSMDPGYGPVISGPNCAHKSVKPGETLPAEWGGGASKWPWAIPLLATSTVTKPELVGHFAPEGPSFNLLVPDQIRVNVFLRHFKKWVNDRKYGKDTMPQFILLQLPDDHTMGTRPGGPSPEASVADNDLAVGRAVDAVSHSPFWNDTAFFILEDDAASGADHVDAHRSTALVISKYAPHGPNGAPYVDSTFYSTVSVIRTMETLLGLPPMNNNDAFCSQIASLFTGPGDQPPFRADYSNEKNGLIYTASPSLKALRKDPVAAAGERASMKMDFTHPDRAPNQILNVILWKQAMGSKPVPAILRWPEKRSAKNNDD